MISVYVGISGDKIKRMRSKAVHLRVGGEGE
jgi:hypothetical protein